MQNVQNAAEIQQRVINLVELYRTKVGKESQIAKDAKEDYDYWEQESINMMDEEGLSVGGGMYGEGPHTELWIKHLMVNEQLLGYFYALVTGENAEKEILDQLLPDVYDRTIFTKEEESFLKNHFKEMVNYIILTPCDDSLELVHRYDGKNAYTIPNEVLELVKARVEIASGSRIYYPNTVFAQMANLFNGCTYYCDTMFYAWTRIAIYANDIVTDTLDNYCAQLSYDAVVSYLVEFSDNSKTLTKIKEAYQNMSTGGKLILLCPSELLWKKNTDKDDCPQTELREQLVHDNSIVEIIQLPSVMSPNLDTHNWCLLIAEKGRNARTATMIDARFAIMDTKYSLSMDDMITMGDNIVNRRLMSTESGRMVMTSGPFGTVLNTNALDEMISNNGFLVKNGLRKMILVDKKQLDADNLLPQIYVIERPVPEQDSISLDSLCQLISRKVKSLDFDLPLDTPWIKEHNLSNLFHGALDIETLEKADCPNNPPHDSDYEFDKDGKFIEDNFHYLFLGGNPKSLRVAQYRACTYLDGKSDAVILSWGNNGVNTALYLSTNKSVVVEGDFVSAKNIKVFYPSRGIDALMLLTILRMPVVYRQIQTYEEFGLNNHLKDILVPWNELLIGDERNRLHAEEEAFKAQNEKYEEMKTDYINEVKMRKHDMRPHLRQLASSQRLMLYYINSVSNIDELKTNLRNQLEHSQGALGNLSAIVDHLSDEEQFGDPELLNIDNALLDIEVNHDDGEGFVIEYDCNNDSFLNSGIKIPNIAEQLEMGREQGVDMVNFIREKAKEKLPLFVNIAAIDFQRLVTNIVENARRHGFTDKVRDDYYIGIELSYNSERGMYQIDFTNNGNPLPDGMTKSRFGIRGEKAGLTAGTGSGGYIVKSIVNHYRGDYDIFCKEGITTVRILLPIATI